MLGFIRNWVPYKGPPIGIDLGRSAIRMAQVETADQEMRLVHAAEFARADGNTTDRFDSLRQALKVALKTGKFRGRSVVVGLDASDVQIKHVRTPRVSGPELNDVLHEQAQTLLGGSIGDFSVRGVVAGDVFGEQEPQQEVVLFATPQSTIHDLLETAASSRVQVVGVHVQPRILAQSFSHYFRRKSDETAVNLFVDMGHLGTRVFVAAPSELRFVRSVQLSTSQIHERISKTINVPAAELDALRRSIGSAGASASNLTPQAPILSDQQQSLINETNAQAARLVDEIEMCRRYYEATFPNSPVSRMIFVGGGARDRLLCAAVAQAMSLPAQIGDPLMRFNRAAVPSLACVDRREAVPQWSVALGLSLCGQSVASL